MYRLSQNQTVRLVRNHVELSTTAQKTNILQEVSRFGEPQPLGYAYQQKVQSFLFSMLTLTVALSTSAMQN